MSKFDVVDLGTKHGNAIQTFLRLVQNRDNKKVLRVLSELNFDPSKIQKNLCLGVERPEAESYRNIVEKKGYKFLTLDLSSSLALSTLPVSRVYLLWHFLEHLPDKESSKQAVQSALSQSTGLVWCRLPSFQQDDQTGEGALRKLGLRFSWTHWRGHTSFWLVEDCVNAINEWGLQNPKRKYDILVKPCDYIKDTADKRVVPIGAPIDTNEYARSQGPKSFKTFQPKLAAAWEVIVRFQ